MASRGRPPKRVAGQAQRARERDCSASADPCASSQVDLAGFGQTVCPSSEDCLLAQAVAGLSIGLVLTTPSGKVVWMNRAAENILGVETGECVRRPLEQALKDPQMSAFWYDTTNQDGKGRAEISVRWPSERDLTLNATRCLDQNGVEIGRALLICDVTSERTVQVELSRAVATRLLHLTSGGMPPEPIASLTHQELRILRLVGRGTSNEEIAERANISPSTVRSHLKSVYRKLGLSSRAEAISYAARNHML
ncbi:MAG: LuxR C-terminal-related transcriptional regulator [Phycisphaerae bacterium]